MRGDREWRECEMGTGDGGSVREDRGWSVREDRGWKECERGHGMEGV